MMESRKFTRQNLAMNVLLARMLRTDEVRIRPASIIVRFWIRQWILVMKKLKVLDMAEEFS